MTRDGSPALSPNRSYWLDGVEPRATEPPLAGREEVDTVVLGGGLTGLLTAYALKRRDPGRAVALLEAEYVGFGASGRNAGLVIPRLHADLVGEVGERAVRFTYAELCAAVEHFADIAREEGIDFGLERAPHLSVALAPAHLERLRAQQAANRALGEEWRLLDRDQLRALVPGRGFLGALEQPRAAILHPGRLLAGLKEALLRRGVRIYEGTPALEVREGPTVEVRTPGGSVRAARVVLGLNAYLPPGGMGVPGLSPAVIRSFIQVTEPLPEAVERELGWSAAVTWSDARNVGNYVRRVGGRVLFGGRVRPSFGVGPLRGEERVFAALQREMVNTFPALAGVRVTHRWHGPLAMNTSLRPAVGRAGAAGNVLYAQGYSGLGVAASTVCARMLRDLVLGEEGRWSDLVYARTPPPHPPEPLRTLAFGTRFHRMRLRDAWEARWV